MTFCSKCGNELSSPDADFCTHCGRSVKEQINLSINDKNKIKKKRSSWWYLLPIIFDFIGGIIAYFVLKDDDPKLAKNCLILGIILTVVSVIVVIILIFAIMSMNYMAFDSIEKESPKYGAQYEYDYNSNPAPKMQITNEEKMQIANDVKEKNMQTEDIEKLKEEVKMKEPVAPVEESSAPKTVSVIIPTGSSSPGCETFNACYLSASSTINVGDTVEWKNTDTAAHTVTGGSPSDGPSGVFDSSLIMGDASFENTFDEVGSYDYFCMVHPWMTGSIRVQ